MLQSSEAWEFRADDLLTKPERLEMVCGSNHSILVVPKASNRVWVKINHPKCFEKFYDGFWLTMPILDPNHHRRS